MKTVRIFIALFSAVILVTSCQEEDRLTVKPIVTPNPVINPDVSARLYIKADSHRVLVPDW